MAYTVLARRYRSNTFDEVVGQDHVAQTLKRAISSGRLAHAFLFCGTRGTGKTSTARILAKCLNCQSSPQPVVAPCGVCDSCKAIARGEDIDVVEIDAASNTGVDNIRETIIASAYNSPARSRFKVFIIDEVHMLSKSAFNALLKTLEEPPAHVKFILATTEPEKVLPTILSRCQRYDFRNIPSREVAAHLKAICEQERIDADPDALLLVAKAGAGSMRDSLSLLDRVLSVGESRLSVGLLEQLLGLPKAQLLFDLVGAVGAGDTRSALGQADAIIANGMSIDTLVAGLIDHLRNLMLIRACGAESDLVEVPGLSLADLSAQAARFDPAALSQDIVLLEELRRHVRQSQAGRALLDATLVRMSLADQFSSLGELLARAGGGGEKKKDDDGGTVNGRVGGGERPTSNVQRPASKAEAVPTMPVVTVPPAPAMMARPAVAPASAAPVVSAPPSLDDEDDDDALPMPGRVWEGPKESLSTLMAKAATPSPAAEPPNVEAVGSADQATVWRAMLAIVAEQQGPALSGLLQNAQFVGVEDGRAVVRLPKQNETFLKLLDKEAKRAAVRAAFSQVLNTPVGVHFEVAADAPAAACDQCGKPATVHRSEVRAGKRLESHLCPACAARQERPATTAAAPPSPAPPPQMAEVANTVRLTDEIRGNLYKTEPLVRAIVDQLGGTVIKLEE
jgi:DNA polymerase-3 subunit gamma/tau